MQAEFLRVDETIVGDGINDHAGEEVTLVKSISYFVDKAFNRETFDSCKNVQFPALSDTIMGLLCGPWGSAECTPRRWWNFMGNVSNGYSPFQITYHCLQQ